MPYLRLLETDTYYEDIGSGYPLILQHGLGGSTEAVTSLYEPADGVRLLTFDFPGHGRSGFSDSGCFSFEFFGSLTKEFMDALGIEKAALGGVSMGAANALNAALRFPERVSALALIRPAWLNAPMSAEVREIFETLHRFMNASGKKEYLESALHETLMRDYPRLDRSFAALFDYERAAETSEKYIRMPLDCPNSSASQLSAVKVPAAVAATGRDVVHQLEYGKALARELPCGEFFEAVSKSDDEALHTKQIQKVINDLVERIE